MSDHCRNYLFELNHNNPSKIDLESKVMAAIKKIFDVSFEKQHYYSETYTVTGENGFKINFNGEDPLNSEHDELFSDSKRLLISFQVSYQMLDTKRSILEGIVPCYTNNNISSFRRKIIRKYFDRLFYDLFEITGSEFIRIVDYDADEVDESTVYLVRSGFDKITQFVDRLTVGDTTIAEVVLENGILNIKKQYTYPLLKESTKEEGIISKLINFFKK